MRQGYACRWLFLRSGEEILTRMPKAATQAAQRAMMIYVIDAVLRVGQTCLHHRQNAAALQIFSCAIADPAGTHYNPRSCFMICIFTMR